MILYLIEIIFIVPFGAVAIFIIMGAILTFGGIAAIIYLFSIVVDWVKNLEFEYPRIFH